MARPHTYPGDVDRVLTVAELVNRIERQCTPHKRDSPNGGRGLPEVEPVAELINPHCAPSFESRRSSLATERVSRIEVLQGRGVSPRRDELHGARSSGPCRSQSRRRCVRTDRSAAATSPGSSGGGTRTCPVPRGPIPADSRPETVPAYSTQCGSGVAVGSSKTSCAFAEIVRENYLAYSRGGSTVVIYASSPVAGKTYQMTCSGQRVVTCTGGDNAVVYIY